MGFKSSRTYGGCKNGKREDVGTISVDWQGVLGGDFQLQDMGGSEDLKQWFSISRKMPQAEPIVA
jgi:hypothetical protein